MNFRFLKISLLLVLVPIIASAQNSIRITGKINPSRNGEKITAMYGTMKKMGVDSVRVINSAFVFNLTDAANQVINLSMDGLVPRDHISLYLGNSDVSLTAKDSLKNAVIKGDQLSEDYSRMNAPIVRLSTERFLYMKKLNFIPADQRKGEAGIKVTAKIQELTKAEKVAAYRAIDENPNSYISLLFLRNLTGTVVYDEVMPYFSKLSNTLKAMPEGKAIEAKLMAVKDLRAGLMAGDFESLTPEGKTLSLHEIVAASKYTLVDFWASWCVPCRAENPNVVSAYNDFHVKGLNIISVSLDTKAENWKAAILKDGMPWLHVSKLIGFEEPAAKLYGIKAIPQNVLVDSKGVIVATNLRGYMLSEKLKQLLN